MDFSMLWAINTLHGEPERINQTVEQARILEELGYDCVWFAEHHFQEYGRPCPDLIAANVAAKTERIAIGVGVFVLPWHHPIDVAERAAVLDHLSNGRFRFGIGRGMQPKEFEGYNVSLWESRARFDEAIEIILGLLHNETFSYQGKFWSFPEIELLPKPVQRPRPPIYQPAVSVSSIEKIVQLGFNGLIGPYLTPWQDLKEKYFDVWNAATGAHGRRDLRMAHNEFVFVGESDEEAYELAREAAVWYPRTAARLWAESDPSKSPPDYAWLAPVVQRFANLEFDDIYNDLSL